MISLHHFKLPRVDIETLAVSAVFEQKSTTHRCRCLSGLFVNEPFKETKNFAKQIMYTPFRLLSYFTNPPDRDIKTSYSVFDIPCAQDLAC